MKVQNDRPIIQLDPKAVQAQRDSLATPKGAVTAATPVPAEKVSISKEALNIQQLEKEIQNVPDVRMDVVERIKAEVDAGTYDRPADQVAESLLTSSLIESLYR
ncbi:MAG TPA: flagellar biosynthesis anti-sigma factor FlgM [bacterium]|nr:flagellar biosynthesis anti-sigma factor FlgM [bacterium]